jgi:hypothetical protein
VPVDRTQEMPKVITPAYVPRPLPAPPAPASAPPPPPSLPPPAHEIELAAPEAMPALVMRFLLACGLVTVLGLLALIYLQL